MTQAARWLAPLLLLALGACSEAVRWEGGPTRKASASASHKPRVRSGATQYSVQRGDTLYSIATRHGIDYHDLASWNGIGSDYRIEIGQVLRLTPPESAPRSIAKRPHREAEVASNDPVAPITAPISPAPSVNLERYYQWQWPLAGKVARSYAPQDGSKGLDIVGEPGQQVIAAAPGRVVYSGSGLKGYGELVIIKHDETYLSAYGYNRKRLVEEGQLVTAGQPIAELGVGPQQQPLLHFEIREHGRPIDPLAVLPKGEN